MAADLTNAAARHQLLATLAANDPTLVVCEGLLVYLSREEVVALGRDLAERPAFHRWLLDLAGPLFLEWGTRTHGSHLAAAGAPFRFAPVEGPDVFRPLGWHPLENRSAWEEARRLGREPWLLRLVWTLSSPRQRAAYKNLSRYVVLGRP